MKLTLPYPPSANRYWRSDRRGRPHVSDEARKYKSGVAARLLVANVSPFAGDVVVHVDFYRPRKIGDLDNSLKVLLDALKGFAYRDDSQVVEIHARRHEDKSDPRAEITITGSSW